MSIRRPILHDILNLKLDPTKAHSKIGKDGHIRINVIEKDDLVVDAKQAVLEQTEEKQEAEQNDEDVEEEKDEEQSESKTERQMLIEKYPELANLRGASFTRRLKKLQQAAEAS